jgi:hypothetical protein
MTAGGDPKKLLAESSDPKVRNFLTRGEENTKNQPGKIHRERLIL